MLLYLSAWQHKHCIFFLCRVVKYVHFLLPAKTLITGCGAHIIFRVCQTCLLKEIPRVLTYFWGEYENAKHCVVRPLPYPMTSITKTIITQTMIPARKRRRTMKSRLVSIAITNPLERVDEDERGGKDSQWVRGESSSCVITRKTRFKRQKTLQEGDLQL